MKNLYIYRGLSGSGKSTKVLEKIRLCKELGETWLVCSADHYFYDEKGQYQFDPRKLGDAHKQSFQNAVDAMGQGVNNVIIDNTNTQLWEFKNYIEVAKNLGYEIQVIHVGGLTDKDLSLYHQRNTHGVGLAAISRMARRWEEYPGEQHV